MDTSKGQFLMAIIILTLSLTAYAANDSLSIDKRWLNLTVKNLSNSGKWLSFTLNSTDYSNIDSLFILDIKNQKKYNVSKLLNTAGTNINLEFVNEFTAVSKQNDILYLIDLKSFTIDSLTQIKKYTTLEESKTIIALNKNGELKKYNANYQCFKINNIEDYFIDPLSKFIIIKDKSNTLSIVDLKTNAVNVIKDSFPYKLTKPIWNTNQSSFILQQNSSVFYLFDLLEKETQVISLPTEEANISIRNVYFNTNNDVILTFLKALGPCDSDKNSEFVDIWNGNAKDLHLKKLDYQSSNKNTNLVYLYKKQTKQLRLIHNSQSLEILPLEIPNHIIYFDPDKNVDYLNIYPKNEYLLKNIYSLDTLSLTIDINLQNTLNLSPDNKFILYPKNERWEILNLENYQKTITNIPSNTISTYWLKNSKSIIYITNRAISEFNLSNQSIRNLITFDKQGKLSVRNSNKSKVTKYLDSNKSLLVFFTDTDNLTSLLLYEKSKITRIVDKTQNRINPYFIKYSYDLNTIIYSEENYNLPPNLISFSSKYNTKQLENYIPEELYSWRKQKKFDIKDIDGNDLSAILYYPKDFDLKKSYPMVVHVYDIQKKDGNIFDIPSLRTDNGFNISLLTERGYFVLLPDTYVNHEGTGLAALQQTNMIIDNIIKEEKSININKIGLKGHSFGAYKTAFITTHTNKYACSVASAGVYDLIMANYSYNYALKKPNYPRFEGHQWYLNESFAENPNKYLTNSPILFAQNMQTPTLLWAGMKDTNVPWEQTRHFYIALKRYGNPVIALFYKNITHVLDKNTPNSSAKKDNIDILIRTLEWYDYFLKDNKEIQWITNGISTN